MRVLMIVTEKLPVPPVRGGAIQTYIAAVAPLLGRQHQLTILGVTDPSLPQTERQDGVEYVRIPGGLLDNYCEGVVSFLRGRQFDLIHIFNRPRLVLPVRSVAPGARLVLSMHNDMFHAQKIHPAEASAAIEQLERIVTVSDYVGKQIGALFPAAIPKLQTVYSGVDLDRFVPPTNGEAMRVRRDLRSAHGLSDKKVILFVGRLSPKKGADVLLRALPEIARQRRDVALVLVGSKWYGEDKVSDYVAYVRALAARSPVPVVTSGFVPPEEVHQWFWTGDLFVCASQWEEPLARVHYEAMASGLPIVTTRRGGNPEVIDGAGVGVVVDEPESPSVLGGVIAKLLGDGAACRKMGLAGRRLSERSFGWQRVAEEIATLWAL